MKSLKIKYLDNYAGPKKVKMPRKGDVGIDLYAAEDVTISVGESALISVGISTEIPDGFWLNIRDRSSISKYCHIMAGVVDSSYRGEIKIRIFCHTSIPYFPDYSFPSLESMREGHRTFPHYHVKSGDKIAQMIICKDYNNEFEIVDTSLLSKTDRGSGGFGSTGS